MKVKCVDHIAITTDDVEKTLDWYKTMLGFDVEKKVVLDYELIFLRATDDTTIEVHNVKDLAVCGAVDDNQVGTRHLAFRVEDIRAWYDSLEQKGAEFAHPFIYLDKLGCNAFLIKDPNGIIIELCEPV